MAVAYQSSPNTVRAHAGDLKTYWTFLGAREVSWERPSLELLGEFTAWLRQPADNVVVLATGRAHRSTKTVNRMLSAVAASTSTTRATAWSSHGR